MLGILCEKPSAARNFAKALGGNEGVFEGTPYKIVAARGHLYEFADPADQVGERLKDTYKNWSLAGLPWNEAEFSWKRDRKKADGIPAVIKDINDVLSKCDEIAIATDDDPTGEGELLAWEILDDLRLHPQKWSRFYFTDEAEASIQKAFRERKPIKSMLEDPDYLKALYRSQWDFLSMQFTRVATCLTGEKLRQGRLKSAMVVLIGDGLKAVSEYKKIPFYQWKFKDENGVVYTNEEEDKFPSRDQVQPNKYHASTVTVDSTEEKHTAPPKLPDLAAISSALASRGIRAKDVLAVYQKMYEDQVVSYPRTEDKVITPEQFDELLPLADSIASVVGVDPSLLTHRTPRPTHVKTGGAHGANRPGPRVPKSLSELEKYGSCAPAIYEMLAKAYLAMLAEDYVYTQQKGHVTEYPAFKGVANKPVSMGFKLVYNDDDEDSDEPKALLGKNAEPFIHEGFPPKPPTPTVKWLMKQLEKRNVGTGATRTSTFAEVSNDRDPSSLVKESKGKITLTYSGEVSYEILPGTHIGSLDITEQVYADMDAIAKGQATGAQLLPNVRALVIDDIKTMNENMPKVREKFPKLGGSGDGRVQKEKATGTYAPTGEGVSFSREWGGHRFSDEEVQLLLAGSTVIFEASFPDGTGTYTIEGKLAKQKFKGHEYWGFAKAEQECPPDKAEGVFKPKKKKVRFKNSWGGHDFTSAEIAALLDGQEISFEATSKAGKQYTAKGKLAEQTYNGTKFWGFKLNFS